MVACAVDASVLEPVGLDNGPEGDIAGKPAAALPVAMPLLLMPSPTGLGGDLKLKGAGAGCAGTAGASVALLPKGALPKLKGADGADLLPNVNAAPAPLAPADPAAGSSPAGVSSLAAPARLIAEGGAGLSIACAADGPAFSGKAPMAAYSATAEIQVQ
jgi:hypothetical protein